MDMNDCVDLRPWAKANRYRWRYEESYRAEKPENRGDGRRYVEVVCQYGLIYPFGGETLIAYAARGVKRLVGELGRHHQHDGAAEAFKIPANRLDEAAAILKPRRKRAAGGSPDHMRAMRERLKALAQGHQDA